MSEIKRLVVGISGGSGAILAIRLLEMLRQTEWEVHVTITKTAEQVIEHETEYDVNESTISPQRSTNRMTFSRLSRRVLIRHTAWL